MSAIYIKNKKYKHSPNITSKVYIEKVDRHKFEANLFEDNGGELVAKIGRDLQFAKENGKLEHWLDEAMKISDFYHNLVDFLEEVKHVRGQNNDH
jgi:hypothetical protein